MDNEYLKCKTPGGESPNGKSRVFFTCHPADFERSFEKICADIFAVQNCAIFYTPDMEYHIPQEDRELDIAAMNLVVIPVSLKLLVEPNRAMDVDVPFAWDHGITVLPIMIETSLNPVYARADRFGKRQYLDSVTTNPTAIPYEEKLKKFLHSVLVDDEMAQGIHNVKDENIVNQVLLERINKIATAENDSEPEHNFLIGLAYLDGIDVEVNRERAVRLITSAAEAGLIEAMEKLYDMYSTGIDVGFDYHKALYWAERTAGQCEKDYGEKDERTLVALHNLAFAYGNNGQYRDALEIDEKVYELSSKVLGEEHPVTLISLNNLAYEYSTLGEHKRALETTRKAYELHSKKLGEENPDTLALLGNLAYEYGALGEHERALELTRKVYGLYNKELGENHFKTMTSLGNLAYEYGKLGNHEKALALTRKAYELHCKILGDEFPVVQRLLGNLAYEYGALGEHERALELTRRVYELRCKVLGEEHPDTVISLHNLAYEYDAIGDHEKALELRKKAYNLSCRVLGEENPDTLTALRNLAYGYGALGENQKPPYINRLCLFNFSFSQS